MQGSLINHNHCLIKSGADSKIMTILQVSKLPANSSYSVCGACAPFNLRLTRPIPGVYTIYSEFTRCKKDRPLWGDTITVIIPRRIRKDNFNESLVIDTESLFAKLSYERAEGWKKRVFTREECKQIMKRPRIY
jgi:hypothetical protein